MIRVLNILGSLGMGGAETAVMNYYRHIDRSKVQFDFLLVGKGGYYEKDAIQLGARIFYISSRSKNPLRAYRELYKILKNNSDINIIHIHTNSALPSLIDAFIAWICKKPTRIVHSTNTRAYKTNLKITQPIFRPFLRMFATNFFCYSLETGISLFGKKAMSKLKIIPNARDLSSFDFNQELRDTLRQEMGLSDCIVLLNVGRLVKVKNQKFLLYVLVELLKVEKDVVLLIVGDGELRDTLPELAKKLGCSEAVRFLGLRTDTGNLMQVADIFLLPSLFEGLPGVVIEAQATGLPCLLADTVPYETKLINTVEFLPINQGVEKWVEKIVAYKNHNRLNTLPDIKKAGYDIKDAAKKLEEFYLNEVK